MPARSAWRRLGTPARCRRSAAAPRSTVSSATPPADCFSRPTAAASGLNLQVASAVVNLDLPWNPAKLEQRIARAWRKNQLRSVSVVNLVAEDTIEHSILHLLGQKQALADGLIDGQGDLAALKMPSGRAALIERMSAMMNAPAREPRIVSAEEEFVADLCERHGEKVLLVEARRGDDGSLRLFAVLDADEVTLAAETVRTAGGAPAVEFVDLHAWRAMRRLAAAGMLHFTRESRELYRSPALPPEFRARKPDEARGAQAILEADRALRMAKTLADGGFPEEAPALLAKSLRAMTAALLAARGETPAGVDNGRRHPPPRRQRCAAHRGRVRSGGDAIAFERRDRGRCRAAAILDNANSNGDRA